MNHNKNEKERILPSTIISMLRNYGVLIALVLIIIIASILEPSFLTTNNALNMLRQASVIGIVSLGVTYVMMTGGMDLSVGATVSFCAVVAITIMNRFGQQGNTTFLTIVVILFIALIGFLIGLVNGGIIATINGRLGETFIITYGMQIVIASLALLISGGQFVNGTFSQGIYQQLGTGYFPIILFLVIAFCMHVVLVYTPFGKQISFIGANMDCAKMSGIRVKLFRTLTYGICGMTAALSSIVVTSRVFSASPLQGTGYELEAIAAVVVGGTSQIGGTGGIINTIFGVLVLSVLGNALNVVGVDANAQLLVRGGIIIIAVALDMFNKVSAQRKSIA